MTTDEHPITELDELVSRFVDEMATEADRQRFDELASADPDLWRRLALAHRDMALLRDAFDRATARATDTELPLRAGGGSLTRGWLAYGGWAAAILLGLWWGMHTLASDPDPNARIVEERRPTATYTAEEHFAQYLQAPYVLGTMQPVVVEVDELSDGRLAVHFIRRVEEFALLNPGELPVDEFGELTSDLSALRAVEPKVPMPVGQ